MAIDFDAFVRWAEERFNGEVLVSGNEVKINSIFTDDRKYHMWCNPYGGKHHRENGCYRCFKTENKGTLTGLVMLVDSCTYEEAQDILAGRSSIRVLEEELHAFFENKQSPQVERPESKLKLPPDSYSIADMPSASLYKMEAEYYLGTRKLPSDDLYFCTDGDYRNRIIIPYYDRDGKLIYFNSRHVNPKAKLRYMGPPKSTGVGKGDVVYCPGRWPKAGEKVYLTEGEFNALTLKLCGFHSLACGGKNLSDKQLDYIRCYKVCLCLDQDDESKAPGYQHAASPGFQAMLMMAGKLMSAFVPVTFVRPPKGYKDWNDMLVALGTGVIAEYITRCEKPLDPLSVEQLMCLI